MIEHQLVRLFRYKVYRTATHLMIVTFLCLAMQIGLEICNRLRDFYLHEIWPKSAKAFWFGNAIVIGTRYNKHKDIKILSEDTIHIFVYRGHGQTV